MDWFASGLPRAGAEASRPRAADAARRDVPTCQLTDRRGDVAERVRAAGRDLAVVVDEDHVVLGQLDAEALGGDPASVVAEAMQPAPTTVRPHLALEDAVESLKRRQRTHLLVTTSDGRLLGVLSLADAERRIAEPGRAATMSS